jgi:hypothetical protein
LQRTSQSINEKSGADVDPSSLLCVFSLHQPLTVVPTDTLSVGLNGLMLVGSCPVELSSEHAPSSSFSVQRNHQEKAKEKVNEKEKEKDGSEKNSSHKKLTGARRLLGKIGSGGSNIPDADCAAIRRGCEGGWTAVRVRGEALRKAIAALPDEQKSEARDGEQQMRVVSLFTALECEISFGSKDDMVGI